MQSLVEKLSARLTQNGMMMAAAESCTGGMIAAAMTDRAGSSAVFERGFVTYSNQSKTELLGVPEEILKVYGAVSRETAQTMVQGALKNSRAQVVVAVTGIAGPSGGSAEKPVGLVYIGYGAAGKINVAEHRFTGDRAAIRQATAEAALVHLLDFLS